MLRLALPWKKTELRLRTRITLLVCTVLLLVLVVTGFMVSWRMEQQTRQTMAEKAALLSAVMAHSELVVGGLQGRRPPEAVQDYAEWLCRQARVDYVVVMDMNRVRLSHPTPSQIGLTFVGGDDWEVFHGRSYTSVAKGTLGLSMRAFTPVLDPRDGRQIGAVAVGILLTGLDQTVESVRKRILLGVLIGFAGGVLGAVYIAGRTKKILLGMEPGEIANLLQQRNALLHSVREGVVAVDRNLAITLVNEEASRLFGLAGVRGQLVGRKVGTVLPGPDLELVLATGRAQLDNELFINNLPIVTSLVPVLVGNEITGVVATFRDKSEVSLLAEQLSGIRLYAEALRAQTHEFMNKLHVILGLIRLGQLERLSSYLGGLTGRLQDEVGQVVQRIKDPMLAGFLLAKFSAAREQDIRMQLAETASVPSCPSEPLAHDIVTILGNLLENAMEAIGDSPRREILVDLRQDQDRLSILVEDSGPGVAPEHLDQVFERGFSTKGGDRGYGLFLARQRAAALGGRLTVSARAGGGASFCAIIQVPGEGAD
jgi:CitB family two-component system sensor histidine kinase MalK